MNSKEIGRPSLLFLYKRWFIITQYISKCSVVGVIDTIMDEYSNEKKAGFFSRLIDAVLGIFGGGSKKRSDSTAVANVNARELSRIDLLEMLVELGKENARLKAEIEDQGREIEKKELLLQAARKNTPVLTTGEEVNLGPSDAQNSAASYRTQMQAAESEARAIDAERRAERALKAEAMVEAAERRAREAEEKAAQAELQIQEEQSVMDDLTAAPDAAEAEIPVELAAEAVGSEVAKKTAVESVIPEELAAGAEIPADSDAEAEVPADSDSEAATPVEADEEAEDSEELVEVVEEPATPEETAALEELIAESEDPVEALAEVKAPAETAEGVELVEAVDPAEAEVTEAAPTVEEAVVEETAETSESAIEELVETAENESAEPAEQITEIIKEETVQEPADIETEDEDINEDSLYFRSDSRKS